MEVYLYECVSVSPVRACLLTWERPQFCVCCVRGCVRDHMWAHGQCPDPISLPTEIQTPSPEHWVWLTSSWSSKEL